MRKFRLTHNVMDCYTSDTYVRIRSNSLNDFAALQRGEPLKFNCSHALPTENKLIVHMAIA